MKICGVTEKVLPVLIVRQNPNLIRINIHLLTKQLRKEQM